MFVTKIKIAVTMMLMTLTCSEVWPMWYCALHAERRTSVKQPLPQNRHVQQLEKDAGNHIPERPDKMFPDGLEYDFGKVARGTLCEHSFRIVNTSNVPLQILSLRFA
jgi:hypothetical protein